MDTKYIKKLHEAREDLIYLGTGPGQKQCGNSAIVNKWFHHPNLMAHGDLKCFRVCALCRNENKNAVIKAEKGNTTNLVSHLRQHPTEYAEYLEAESAKRKRKAKRARTEASDSQGTMHQYARPVCQED